METFRFQESFNHSSLLTSGLLSFFSGGSDASRNVTNIPSAMDKVSYSSACAAAGQVRQYCVLNLAFNRCFSFWK